MTCLQIRPDIGGDGGVLLRPTAFPKDETSFHIDDVLLAELLDSGRLPIFFSFLCRILPLSNPAELRFSLTTRGLRGPYAMEADRVATRPLS